MRGLIINLGSVATLAVLVAGCEHRPFPDYSELPPDYSPRYTSVAVLTPSGREKHVLVPEACITPDKESPAEMGEQRLAPGCANNYNLQRMVERKGDLKRGRKMDKASGEASARAAQRYIEGKEGTLGGGDAGPTSGISASGTATTQ